MSAPYITPWRDDKSSLGTSTKRFKEAHIMDLIVYRDLTLADNLEIYFGSANDVSMVWDGSNFYVRPVADDTGAFLVGDGTTDMDFKWFGGASTKYVLMDVGNVLLQLEDVDLKLGDTDILQFGDASGGDVNVTWSGSLLQISPATDDTGSINIGNGTADIDFKVFLGTASQYALFDVGNSALALTGIDFTATKSSSVATATTVRTVDVGQTMTGASAVNSAEAARFVLTSNVQMGSWANALMAKVDLSTTGRVTGLVGVVCAELTMPGGAISGSTGTYSCYEAEINCPTSYASDVPIHVFQVNAWGAAVGYFDDYGYLFELTGVTSEAGHIWYDHQAAAASIEEWVRVKTPAGVRYLALYNAVA